MAPASARQQHPPADEPRRRADGVRHRPAPARAVRTLVVVESLWGDTARIARAVADALRSSGAVDLLDAESASATTIGYDLLVVGGPTHHGTMRRPLTRMSAMGARGGPHLPASGIREWLDALAPPATRIHAAAFDTHTRCSSLPGSAAHAARRRLRAMGFDTSTRPRSFRVASPRGPLVDGELDRATAWARGLAAAAGA